MILPISIIYDKSSNKLYEDAKGEIININIPLKTDEYTFFYLIVNKNINDFVTNINTYKSYQLGLIGLIKQLIDTKYNQTIKHNEHTNN